MEEQNLKGNSEQELTQKFMMFEQQIRFVQEQLQAVEQAIVDINTLNMDLDELNGSVDKEVFASIGKGIYAKAKLISEELIVDVGGKNFVKKSIPETKRLLEEQSKKLESIKEDLNAEAEKINEDLTRVFMESQGKSKE